MRQDNAYVINPAYCVDRVDDRRVYQAIDKAIAEWKPVDDIGDFCGNIGMSLAYSRKAGKVVIKDYDQRNDDDVSLSQAISSALVLYRLACVFTPKVKFDGREGYKFVWSAAFRHEPTGVEVLFYEWKGAFTLGVRTLGNGVGDPKKMTAAQRRALLSLLNLMLSPKLTHPYDGTVAGSVA